MKNFYLKNLRVIICDFDGVLTDNKVYVDQQGREMVCCSRADGLAFNLLSRTHIRAFILTTEKNPVVARRAEKIKVPLVYGGFNKLAALKKLAKRGGFSLDQVLYVGNDVNDLEAMLACAWKVCPSDSYSGIKKIANIVLSTKGGNGVVSELVEYILDKKSLRKVL